MTLGNSSAQEDLESTIKCIGFRSFRALEFPIIIIHLFSLYNKALVL